MTIFVKYLQEITVINKTTVMENFHFLFKKQTNIVNKCIFILPVNGKVFIDENFSYNI